MVQHRVYLDPPRPLRDPGYFRLEESVQESEYQYKCRLAGSLDYWALERVAAWSDQKLQRSLECRGIIHNYTTRRLRHDLGKVRSQKEKRHHRAERGLLIYEDMTLSVLQKFANSRRLEPDVNASRKSKSYLVELLEKADEEASFPRFESLAVELRHMVYDHYFAALDSDSAHVPLLPPLVKVSRQLRAESLPRLYDILTLHHGWYNRNSLCRIKLTNQHEHISRIRHVKLSWPTDCSEIRPGEGYHRVTVRIDMLKDEKIPALRWGFLNPSGEEIDPPAFNPNARFAHWRISEFKTALGDFHQKLIQRAVAVQSKDGTSSDDGEEFQKGLGLRTDDFGELVRVLDAVYRPW